MASSNEPGNAKAGDEKVKEETNDKIDIDFIIFDFENMDFTLLLSVDILNGFLLNEGTLIVCLFILKETVTYRLTIVNIRDRNFSSIFIGKYLYLRMEYGTLNQNKLF